MYVYNDYKHNNQGYEYKKCNNIIIVLLKNNSNYFVFIFQMTIITKNYE